MRNPHGVMILEDPQGPSSLSGRLTTGPKSEAQHKLELNGESDTFTCGHCDRIVLVPPFVDAASQGARCGCCGRLICGDCNNKARCEPWEERLQREEAAAAALRSYQEG